MRLSFSALLLLALLPASVGLPSLAQTFPAITGPAPAPWGNVPDRVASPLPPHHKRSDAPLMYARIRDGVYSVDGMVGKVRLNYDVKGASHLYLFMPGVGTAVISLTPAGDAVATPATYADGQLALRVGGHTWNLTGVESLVNDAGKEPVALYVELDSAAWKLARTPMVGFGTADAAPYQWPGALSPAAVAAEAPEAPSLPVPANLLPRQERQTTASSSSRTAATPLAPPAATTQN